MLSQTPLHHLLPKRPSVDFRVPGHQLLWLTTSEGAAVSVRAPWAVMLATFPASDGESGRAAGQRQGASRPPLPAPGPITAAGRPRTKHGTPTADGGAEHTHQLQLGDILPLQNTRVTSTPSLK